MTKRCAKGMCIAGAIVNKPILCRDWQREAIAFQKVIRDWNERTKRFAIPHPGFCEPSKYCGNCGRSLAEFHKNNGYLSQG